MLPQLPLQSIVAHGTADSNDIVIMIWFLIIATCCEHGRDLTALVIRFTLGVGRAIVPGGRHMAPARVESSVRMTAGFSSACFNKSNLCLEGYKTVGWSLLRSMQGPSYGFDDGLRGCTQWLETDCAGNAQKSPFLHCDVELRTLQPTCTNHPEAADELQVFTVCGIAMLYAQLT